MRNTPTLHPLPHLESLSLSPSQYLRKAWHTPTAIRARRRISLWVLSSQCATSVSCCGICEQSSTEYTKWDRCQELTQRVHNRPYPINLGRRGKLGPHSPLRGQISGEILAGVWSSQQEFHNRCREVPVNVLFTGVGGFHTGFVAGGGSRNAHCPNQKDSDVQVKKKKKRIAAVAKTRILGIWGNHKGRRGRR